MCEFLSKLMDFSYVLIQTEVLKERLADFGFIEQNNNCICKKALKNADFYTILKLSSGKSGLFETLKAQVFETSTDELYALFDVENANGSFVGEIREQVKDILNQFKIFCCKNIDVKQKYLDFLKTQFEAKAETPWPDTPEYEVFRCKNEKWFALIMKIKFRQLGIPGEEEIFVVNLKSDCEKIPDIVDKKSVFPAWHMNKKHWITVLLSPATKWENLCSLTKRSFELVNKKTKRT